MSAVPNKYMKQQLHGFDTANVTAIHKKGNRQEPWKLLMY